MPIFADWGEAATTPMNTSTRTPEGFPGRCPLCGADTDLEFSDPVGDAPCPQCGCLVWRSAQLLEEFRRIIAETLGVPPEELEDGKLIEELEADSITLVELVMRTEATLAVQIPDEDYEHIRTIADLVRYIERRQRGD